MGALPARALHMYTVSGYMLVVDCLGLGLASEVDVEPFSPSFDLTFFIAFSIMLARELPLAWLWVEPASRESFRSACKSKLEADLEKGATVCNSKLSH